MKETTSMQKILDGYFYENEQIRRLRAVEAALEIVQAEASSGAPTSVGKMMSSLGAYADRIQEAIEAKGDINLND